MIWIHGAILSLLFFCFGFFAHAASAGDVIINEIAWMGSPPDAGETAQQALNDEWIELYNPTDGPVSLAGWKLLAADGNPEISLAGTMEPQGYFLLSRANQKVSGIAADLVYAYKNNALSNEGEHLNLFDSQGNLIDEVAAEGGWFGGDNIAKQTMERKNSILTGSDPVNWGTSVSPGGTPKSQNSLSPAAVSLREIFMTGPQPPQPEPLPAPPLSPPALAPEGNNSSTTSNSSLPPLIVRGGTEEGVNMTTTATTTQQVEMPVISPTENLLSKKNQEELQAPKVKEVKVIKKNENNNMSSSTSTLPSRQVAAIGAVAPQNKNIFMYALALLLALLSAGTILILKKRLQK